MVGGKGSLLLLQQFEASFTPTSRFNGILYSVRAGGFDQINLLEGYCASVSRPKCITVLTVQDSCNVLLLFIDCLAVYLIELFHSQMLCGFILCALLSQNRNASWGKKKI